jgi:hypothetical protein
MRFSFGLPILRFMTAHIALDLLTAFNEWSNSTITSIIDEIISEAIMGEANDVMWKGFQLLWIGLK